jgi:prolipoprotein diacylglyceryltransferase
LPHDATRVRVNLRSVSHSPSNEIRFLHSSPTFSVCWVVLAYVVARWSNFFSYVLWGINKTKTPDTGSTAAVGRSDVDVNLTVLRLALVGFSVVTMLGLYLTVYLPRVKGLPLKDSASWAPVYCPTVIPSMAVTFAVSFILLIRSVWPIYGFLSPIIASAQFIALFMSTHLIPTFGLC